MIPKDCIEQIVTDTSGWNDLDTMAFQLLGGKLAQDVGTFKVGTQVQCVDIDFAGGKVQAFDIYGNTASAAIKLTLEPITQ